jgi:hypothetical protein
MILTQCAVCATELGTGGKKCGRCQTRYCGPACQKEHWESGGHDKLCKKIKKGGGAELYHADKRTKEAVVEAVEKCAADTKGQTCYICTQALHWKTKEGLVRMCACRGTAGVAHVSCLAEQAKILVAEAEENNLDAKAFNERWRRWDTCSLCNQGYHGVVSCALGWACWKTYLGRPEEDATRISAMRQLGSGLSYARHNEEALYVKEAELSILRRRGTSEANIFAVQSNLANTYDALGRLEEAMRMKRDVYFGWLRLMGEEDRNTFLVAGNYALALIRLQHFKQAKTLLRKVMPVARRVLRESNDLTLKMRFNYARALYMDPAATLNDLREAVTTSEEIEGIARHVLGGAHLLTTLIEKSLQNARAALRARETQPSPLPSSESV